MTDLYGTVTGTDDACTVRFERDCAASPDDLWSAITTPQTLARWLDNADGDLREGGRVVVHFDDGDATFVIDRCRPPSGLDVTWTGTGDPDGEGGDPAGATQVQVEIAAREGGGSRLVLVHDGLSAAAAPEYATSWHWYLDALVAIVDDQDDGPTDWDELAVHYRGVATDETQDDESQDDESQDDESQDDESQDDETGR